MIPRRKPLASSTFSTLSHSWIDFLSTEPRSHPCRVLLLPELIPFLIDLLSQTQIAWKSTAYTSLAKHVHYTTKAGMPFDHILHLK